MLPRLVVLSKKPKTISPARELLLSSRSLFSIFSKSKNRARSVCKKFFMKGALELLKIKKRQKLRVFVVNLILTFVPR